MKKKEKQQDGNYWSEVRTAEADPEKWEPSVMALCATRREVDRQTMVLKLKKYFYVVFIFSVSVIFYSSEMFYF